MILRRYIHKVLSDYYQQPCDKVVGSIQSNSIDFKSLFGEWHWRRVYGQLYKKQSGQWLTPVELFRPYYSQILANYIAEQGRGQKKIDIVEIGGGRGTNAKCILDHLQHKHSDIYNCDINYTIMDASSTLLELQRNILFNNTNVEGIKSGGSQGHHDRILHLKELDMLDVAEKKSIFMEESSVLTIVIANEVLDNLPHDKLSTCSKTGQLMQTNLYKDKDTGTLQESFVPLQDKLLKHMVDIYPPFIPTNGAKWVPTVAAHLLTQIFEKRYNASVLFADFDYLPPPDILSTSSQTRISYRAEGEPLVTDMNDVDHECYLASPPLCDILFPTDFHMLNGYVSATLEETLKNRGGVVDARPYKVSVKNQRNFLALYGPEEVEETKSRWTGYSPLLHDFSNCSILSVSRL